MNENQNDSQGVLNFSQEDLETILESTMNQEILGRKTKPKNNTQNTPSFEGSLNQSILEPSSGSEQTAQTQSDASRSSLGKKYDREVAKIQDSIGDLESIRRKLQLSKRKMAQLLMVDPSAWTRWTKKSGQAPPHIYRALEWYMLLQEKHPEYRSALWLNSVATPQISAHELENIRSTLLNRLESELEGKKDRFFEEQSLNDRHIQKQLNSAQVKIKTLNKRIRWLLIGQVFLITVFLVFIMTKL